jgi:type I restriction enzyme S subunit
MRNSNRKLSRLKDVCLDITVGYVGSMSNEYVDQGVPLLRSLNINSYWLNLKDLKYVSTEFHRKISKSSLSEGDVVIVRTGQPGTSCVIPKGFKELNCSDLVIARPKIDKIDPFYLSFYFNSIAKKYVENQLVGAIQQHFNIGSAKEMLIDLPIMDEQKKVVKILNDINKKIELNNRINAELEQMAKTIYDYWFVQFDFPISAEYATSVGQPELEGKPYKSSGGKMVWSEELKREVPKGWGVKKLEEVERNIITGKTPSTVNDKYFNGNIPFICIGDVRGNMHIVKTEISLTSEGAQSQNNKFIPKGAICVTCIASPGLVGFATKDSQTNQQLNSIVCKHEENRYYLYFYLIDYFKYAQAKTGNTFANMNKGDFSEIKIIKPSQHILHSFKAKLDSAVDKILNNSIENQKLTELRDWLLPMLMNGQVRVGDVEDDVVMGMAVEPVGEYKVRGK